MLHLNASEARALSGLSDLDEAMRALHQRTQAPVIATLGRHGARVLAEDGALLTVPGQPVERVADTIGAGTHAAPFCWELSRGLSLPDAVALGNRASAQVVQTAGATLSDEALSARCPAPNRPSDRFITFFSSARINRRAPDIIEGEELSKQLRPEPSVRRREIRRRHGRASARKEDPSGVMRQAPPPLFDKRRVALSAGYAALCLFL
ncbi:MAG: carbohydrate kinase family protein [Christensenellales bacterium]